MKISVLYLKIKALDEIKSIEKLVNKYLETYPNLYTFQRIYLEKGFFTLASHFDKFLFFEINGSNCEIATNSAILYCKALKHGHCQYYHSMTRLLTLFFGICSIKQERPELFSLMEELSEKLPLFV